MVTSKRRAISALAILGAGLSVLGAGPASAQKVTVTNLVSDGFVPAVTTDASLINPWGIAYAPANPFWVANNNAGNSTLYNGAGTKIALTVNIPPPTGLSGSGTPTGTVYNPSSTSFMVKSGSTAGAAAFLFATEDGTISGWAPSVDATNAILAVDNSKTGAVYKGLAIATIRTSDYIYATNFRAGDVEMYNSKFRLVKTFTDPTVPAGYAPFNVQTLDGMLYVTFAKQDRAKHDDVAGLGFGFVDIFRLNGTMIRRLVSNGNLDSPWGLDIAPANFGPFAGALLVGNFGNGKINVYGKRLGFFLGQVQNSAGKPLVIGDLWGLINGGGGASGDASKVYFAAGLVKESHGLFGSLTPAP